MQTDLNVSEGLNKKQCLKGAGNTCVAAVRLGVILEIRILPKYKPVINLVIIHSVTHVYSWIKSRNTAVYIFNVLKRYRLEAYHVTCIQFSRVLCLALG